MYLANRHLFWRDASEQTPLLPISYRCIYTWESIEIRTNRPFTSNLILLTFYSNTLSALCSPIERFGHTKGIKLTDKAEQGEKTPIVSLNDARNRGNPSTASATKDQRTRTLQRRKKRTCQSGLNEKWKTEITYLIFCLFDLVFLWWTNNLTMDCFSLYVRTHANHTKKQSIVYYNGQSLSS